MSKLSPIVSTVKLELFERDKGLPKIGGYAAKFNEYSNLMYDFYTLFEPGAFTMALADPDIKCTLNVGHNDFFLLGRYCPKEESNTLSLVQDEIGLRFEVDTPDTSIARDYIEHIRKGNIRGCSCAVVAFEDDWSGKHEGYDVRRIKMFSKIYDVCLTPSPAFPGTSVGVSKYGLDQMTKEDYEALRNSKAPYKVPSEYYKNKLKLIEMELDTKRKAL